MMNTGDDCGVEGKAEDSSTKLALSQPHLVSRGHADGTTSARQAILAAVDTLETENARLHQLNSQLDRELNDLRRENAQLRRELEHFRSELESMKHQQGTLQQDNVALRRELERHAAIMAQESRKCKEQEMMVSMVKQDSANYLRQLEELREQVSAKDRDLKAALRELQAATGKLDRASRRNFNDRDIELLHEVELLKEEKRDVTQEKDALEQKNTALCNEIANLKSMLDQQLSELKNENRRHALLTKEFNSLLEENNHLKLQLRRRNRHGAPPSSRDADPIETVQKINREASSLVGAKKFHSSTNLPITRESTFLNQEGGSTRDLTLQSRERTLLTREQINLRRQPSSSRLSGCEVSRESSGDSNRGSADSPAASDTILPSITAGSSARTWKP